MKITLTSKELISALEEYFKYGYKIIDIKILTSLENDGSNIEVEVEKNITGSGGPKIY